jgi:hypothetical protein
MSIEDRKPDNLVKMLDGFSLLDDQDKERFIGVVDTLECADRQVKKSLFNDTLARREKREQGSTA